MRFGTTHGYLRVRTDAANLAGEGVAVRCRDPSAAATGRTGVGRAQTVRHAGEQLAREPGDLVDDPGELALAEHDELHRGLGGRRSRCAGPCRAGRARRRPPRRPSEATLRPLAGDAGRAVDDHEELVAGLALGDEDLAGVDPHVLRPAGHRAPGRAWSRRRRAGPAARCSMKASLRDMAANLTTGSAVRTDHSTRNDRGLEPRAPVADSAWGIPAALATQSPGS